MLSKSELIIAAAGGGKTTRIVNRVLKNTSERVALLTYTKTNTEEIKQKIYTKNATIPTHVEVLSWYTFLLREMARPYQTFLYPRRIEGMFWSKGQSTKYILEIDIEKYFFANEKFIYSDKISHFIVACNKKSDGAIIRRIEQRFDRIYIDEIQDIAGYDLVILELLLKSKLNITMVGDHRQVVYQTNNAKKYKKFRGVKILDKFNEWKKKKLLELTFENETHRCNQEIAKFSDTLFPNAPRTISLNKDITGHDGVYFLPSSAVGDYVKSYQPQVLRYDKNTNCLNLNEQARNFGECKGQTFDRVLIFPNGQATKWLTTGDYSHIEASAAKMYVAITRARYSVAFVLDDETPIANINRLITRQTEPSFNQISFQF